MAIDYTSASIARPQVPRQFFCDEVGRREFLCGGGAGVLSVTLATLLAVGNGSITGESTFNGSIQRMPGPNADGIGLYVVVPKNRPSSHVKDKTVIRIRGRGCELVKRQPRAYGNEHDSSNAAAS
jgi:hypothetical protein